MLESVPKSIGAAMKSIRAGTEKLAIHHIDTPMTMAVESDAFGDGRPMPARYTADGEGLSPELAWRGVPAQARCVALIVEDPDAPMPQPLVHAIAPSLPREGALAAGALSGEGIETGRNSYLKHGYLPPDPPTGHGPHRYAFEMFALAEEPRAIASMGRGELIDWLRSHALAKGCLIGTYERT
jgi:Raf kinase inhibitor-like YbhB/YbcL family protein